MQASSMKLSRHAVLLTVPGGGVRLGRVGLLGVAHSHGVVVAVDVGCHLVGVDG